MAKKVKVKIIKTQEKTKELKSNIKIKVSQVEEDKKDDKGETLSNKPDFIEEKTGTGSSAPIIPIERISPVRNLDEVSETPRRAETETNQERMYSEADVRYLGAPESRNEETKRVYNPERVQTTQRSVEPRNTELRARESNIARVSRLAIAPSELIEEKRDLRNPNRNESEQMRGFYKEYEDLRKYEEGREPSKERRRRTI